MLVIRAKQMAAIAAAMDPGREADMREHIRKNHADAASKMGEAALNAWLAEWLGRAVGYGLMERGDLVRLLDIVMTLGPGLNADDAAWLDGMLGDAAQEPSRRMEKLHRRFLYRLEALPC